MQKDITERLTTVSSGFIDDDRLTLKTKGLLLLIMSLPQSFPWSAKRLRSFCKDGGDAINCGLVALEKAGYLKRVIELEADGKYKGIDYQTNGGELVDAPSIGLLNAGSGNLGAVESCSETYADKESATALASLAEAYRNVMRDASLSFRTKGIYAWLHSHCDSQGNQLITVNELAALSTDGSTGVAKSLTELENRGYLTRLRKKDERGQAGGMVYHLVSPTKKNR